MTVRPARRSVLGLRCPNTPSSTPPSMPQGHTNSAAITAVALSGLRRIGRRGDGGAATLVLLSQDIIAVVVGYPKRVGKDKSTAARILAIVGWRLTPHLPWRRSGCRCQLTLRGCRHCSWSRFPA